MSVADTEENLQDLNADECAGSDPKRPKPKRLDPNDAEPVGPAASELATANPTGVTASDGAPGDGKPSDGAIGDIAANGGAFVVEPILAYTAIDAGAFCHDVMPSSVADTNEKPATEPTTEIVVEGATVDASPESTSPESTSPESVLPESTSPESVLPESVLPESVLPESVLPESVLPETTVPVGTASGETATPDVATPQATTLGVTAPEASNQPVAYEVDVAPVVDVASQDEASNDSAPDDILSHSTAEQVPPLVSQAETEKIHAAAQTRRVRPKKVGFEGLQLRDEVLEAIADAGYDTPSAIQRQTIPHVLAGSDLLGQAETGSGKTAAFAFPLLSMIDVQLTRPQVLILAPTRELAIQVTEAIRRYAAHVRGFRAVTIYGGQSYDGQLRELKRGVQIVVGTPGRIMDHMNRGTLKLHDLKCLVLDEADEMLRMGFIDDVEWILTKTPQERQILLFSATLPEPIRRIAQQHLKDPKQITVKGRNITADSIRQRYVVTTPREKTAMLTRILEAETTDGVIVFVKTRNQTVDVAEKLADAGYSSSHLNGDMPQSQRERTVENFRSGKLAILVATDVAARGLDVERVSHVINFDFPHDVEAYVHRIGRTGRAGRSGNAILFVGHRERGRLGRIESATNQKLEQMHKPSIKVINENRVTNFKERIVTATKEKDLDFFTKLITEIQAENDLPTEVIAAALAKLVQGKVPLVMKEPPQRERNGRDRDGGKDRHNDRVPYGERGFKRRGSKEVERGMQRYRIEVGRAHGVGPKNIVGALANESGIDSQSIGRIEIFDLHSTVDLPQNLDSNFFRALKGVRVGGEQLRLTRDKENGKRFDRSAAQQKNFGKSKFSNSDRRPSGKPQKTKVKIKGKSKGVPGANAKKRRVK